VRHRNNTEFPKIRKERPPVGCHQTASAFAEGNIESGEDNGIDIANMLAAHGYFGFFALFAVDTRQI
jgi:hypothetical protein